jgi:16S rRNA (adenine1518-N6/adenine1519-N6)-dimethyltransferase
MESVRAKKFLGQHFLKDLAVAERIADSLQINRYKKVLEIGPGMGILTQFLLKKPVETFVIEIDRESVRYLNTHFPTLKNHIIEADFLKISLADFFSEPFAIIGNFPYNISSQIVFKTLENRNIIPEFSGMFQKRSGQTHCRKAWKQNLRNFVGTHSSFLRCGILV